MLVTLMFWEGGSEIANLLFFFKYSVKDLWVLQDIASNNSNHFQDTLKIV